MAYSTVALGIVSGDDGVMDNPGAMKVRLRNLLCEFEMDSFLVVGYIGQDEFVFRHNEGKRDERALNLLLIDEAEKIQDQQAIEPWQEE